MSDAVVRMLSIIEQTRHQRVLADHGGNGAYYCNFLACRPCQNFRRLNVVLP